MKFLSYFIIRAIDRRIYRFFLQHFYNRIENYRNSSQYRNYLLRSEINESFEFFFFYSTEKRFSKSKSSRQINMTESKKNEKHLRQHDQQQFLFFEQQIRSSSSIQIKKIKISLISNRLHFADEEFVTLRENFFNKSKRVITEKEQSIISSTKKFKHRFDRTENFLKIIMKQMSFSFNRVFNYIKTQYARNNAIIMMMIKNLQFFDSFFC